MPSDDCPALDIVGITKRFGSTVALDDVTFTIRPGSVHALLGGNGSGKSTMVKVLAGVHHADTGTVHRRDTTIAAADMTPDIAKGLGLRFVHQMLGLFPTLSVAENLALVTGYPRGVAGRIDWRATRRQAVALIERFGIPAAPDALAGALRPAAQTLLAIARALADDRIEDGPGSTAHLLVMDEATAALPRLESLQLLQSLRALADSGRAVLFISHRVDEVIDFADDITVLRDGRVEEQLDGRGLTHTRLVSALTGAPTLRASEPRDSASRGPLSPRLVVSDLHAGPLRGVSITAHVGEVLGVSGLLGSGRSTLLEAVFGSCDRRSGVVEVDGQQLAGSTRRAMDAGVALVPEDRERRATFASRTVAENLTEATVQQYWRRNWLSERRVSVASEQMIMTHGVVARSPHSPMSTLSGGNKQKVVIARWLARRPGVLLLDEPTQGVDLAARSEIHHTIRDVVRKGASAVVVSSDVDELMTLCDRIIVLAHGEVVAECLPPFDASELLALEQSQSSPATKGQVS